MERKYPTRHQLNRRMTSFLGYDPANENRFDHSGAVLDEKERAEYIRKYKNVNHEEVKKRSRPIGTHIYNFKNQTEKFFEYKSRGNPNSKLNF